MSYLIFWGGGTICYKGVAGEGKGRKKHYLKVGWNFLRFKNLKITQKHKKVKKLKSKNHGRIPQIKNIKNDIC